MGKSRYSKTKAAGMLCGRSDDMHGYRFTCYVSYWGGISGENEQLSMAEVML